MHAGPFLLLFLDFDSLLSGLKFDVLISGAAFFFRSSPSAISPHESTAASPLEPRLATGSMTKSVQGEGEIQGRSHLLQRDRKNKRKGGKKQKGGEEKKKIRQKPSRWMEFFHSSRCFFRPQTARGGCSFYLRPMEAIARKGSA